MIYDSSLMEASDWQVSVKTVLNLPPSNVGVNRSSVIGNKLATSVALLRPNSVCFLQLRPATK